MRRRRGDRKIDGAMEGGRGRTGSGTRGWAARARVTCVARVCCLHPHRCSRDQLEHCVTRTQYRQRSFSVCEGKTDSVLIVVDAFSRVKGRPGHYAWPPMTSSAGGGRRAAENERRAALLKTPRLLEGDFLAFFAAQGIVTVS